MAGDAQSAHSFLDRVAPSDRAALLDAGHPRRYRAGEPIFVVGGRGGFVVLILEGRAKIIVPAPTGTETVLGLRGPGDLVGELSAVEDEPAPRSATVVAVDPVVCRVVRNGDFRSLLAGRPSIALELLGLVASRLRSSDRRLVEIGAYDTAQRVARLLADMAESGGRPSEAGLVLPAGLTQDDLAGMVDASRESVARALAALRSLGLVSTARRQVVVHDLPALRAYGH